MSGVLESREHRPGSRQDPDRCDRTRADRGRDQGFQALGRCVHRGGQARWPGADDRDVEVALAPGGDSPASTSTGPDSTSKNQNGIPILVNMSRRSCDRGDRCATAKRSATEVGSGIYPTPRETRPSPGRGSITWVAKGCPGDSRPDPMPERQRPGARQTNRRNRRSGLAWPICAPRGRDGVIKEVDTTRRSRSATKPSRTSVICETTSKTGLGMTLAPPVTTGVALASCPVRLSRTVKWSDTPSCRTVLRHDGAGQRRPAASIRP